MTRSPTAPDVDPAIEADRWKTFDYRNAMWRELDVRAGNVEPRDDRERAQAEQGLVPTPQLDCFKAKP